MTEGADMLGISPDGSWVLSPEVVFDESRPDRGAPAVVDLDRSHHYLLVRRVPMTTRWPIACSPDGTRFVGEARGGSTAP
jgi:hypothetical protein